jgi:hypothetical protein
VNPSELAFLIVMIVLLVGLAGYFGWRQLQTLGSLRTQPAEEQPYLRRQAIRRLICCVLMLVLAGMLLGSLPLDASLQEMRRELERRPQGDEAVPEEHKDLFRLYVTYWMAALCVLFALLALAAVDFWAIARFGARHRRQLQADHRAGLKEEIARLRRRHNGNGE